MAKPLGRGELHPRDQSCGDSLVKCLHTGSCPPTQPAWMHKPCAQVRGPGGGPPEQPCFTFSLEPHCPFIQ